jgi:hypothetical protein
LSCSVNAMETPLCGSGSKVERSGSVPEQGIPSALLGHEVAVACAEAGKRLELGEAVLAGDNLSHHATLCLLSVQAGGDGKKQRSARALGTRIAVSPE